MNEDKLNYFFKLAEELYCEMQKKSGMISPIPYAFAKGENSYPGAMIVVSMNGKDSEWIRLYLKEMEVDMELDR